MTDTQGINRRQTLAGAGAFGLALASGTALAAESAGEARGTVFEDKDGSGKPGASNPGLEGVMVSNGRDVVKTDASGKWSLPVSDGQSIFVIKPSGFMTPIDPVTCLPNYAHIHAPTGTPDQDRYRFAGVAPTGPLPASIDFPLTRQAEPTKFNAILFTDTQPESLAEVGFIRDDVVARTTGVDAAFGITHGDIMFDDLSYYERYNRIIGTIGLPWYNICGNHDMNLEAADNTWSRETFKQTFGARYHAFQYGGATIFLLDNVDYLGTDPAKPNGFGKYQGHFGADQLTFVRNVLANVPTDSLVIYSFHIPLKTYFDPTPANNTIDLKDFLATISTHPHSVSFCGHTHTNEQWYFGPADGFTGGTHHHNVMSAVSGSWWSGPFDERGIPVTIASDGAPNGFHLLAVDGNTYVRTLMPAHEREGGHMRIMLDSQLHRADKEVLRDYSMAALLRGPIAKAAAPSTKVVVNVFDGGEKSVVELSIGRRTYQPMKKVMRKDPFVEELYARNQATKKPWVEAVASSHIWELALPRDLPVGTHKIRIRAKDEYGRVVTDSMVLEVTG